ncbi:MAG: hypothetical protein M1812_005348 [Candelaria pacifica]|nr:MAG: hypothetical protein M1812_005348 [Candelaria pacifica]
MATMSSLLFGNLADDPYTLEQMKAPRINISIVRPLVDRLHDLKDISVVYCLLVNRVHFLREHSHRTHHQTVSNTRAILCELVASKILRRYNEENPGSKGLLLLANVLVAGFDPFQNAPEHVVREYSLVHHWAVQKRGGHERKSTALEVAIISESKLFLSSSACQEVVDAIYKGRVIYTPTSFIDILPDHYKHKLISLYNPRKGHLLNQYRLIVPRTRNIVEVYQFLILLVLYLLVMTNRRKAIIQIYEPIFMVYALGWILDQCSSILEHGWQVYTQNLWAFLDVTFTLIFTIYFWIRIHSLAISGIESNEDLALDVLSIAAPVLVPRLAFNLMSENMLFVSLRAMFRDFAILSLLAVWSFAGFLLAMTWLGPNHRPITVSKWMLWVWFGLDGTGIQRSIELHWLLGPVLMVTYAFLGNTLFLTILVSMLSNTFATIVTNATEEIQFRRAVLTFMGVKSDAIFAYLPPFNLLALTILLPLKFIVTPRWFHKVNVTAVRILNAPLLLLIAFYERKIWAFAPRQHSSTTKTANKDSWWELFTFSRFTVRGDIQGCFDAEPEPSLPEESQSDVEETPQSNIDDLNYTFYAKNGKRRHESSTPQARQKPRRVSMGSIGGDHPDTLHDTKQRLEALEASTTRIENLLDRLCRDMGDNATSDNDSD